MCNINDPRILNAYIAITEDEPTDWLILGYRDTRDVISLYASGVHGLSEFRNNLTNEILFGFVRVEDKFILITYVPDSVSGVRRARALVHSRAVAGVLELSHAQFTASSLSDLSDANVRTRLKLGQNQVPNRPRSVTKRASFVVQQRRRRSGTYSPSPSSPSPISERNLKLHLNTTEEPYSYYEDSSDRMTATPTPSTPTSVASSSYNNSESPYFAVATDNNAGFNAVVDEQERKRLQDHTEAMLQFQLSKKKELEEARFRQFQRDQQEERFKREQSVKRIEEEEKRQSLLQQQKATKQKELPKWQQELIQRKLKKQQEQQQQQQQAAKDQPSATVELKPTQPNEKVVKPLQQLQKPTLSEIQIPERSASPVPQTPLQMVQLKSTPRSFTTPVEPSKRESIILKQKSISDLQTKKTQDRPASPAMATPIAASTVSVSTAAEPVIVASPDVIKEDIKVLPSESATLMTGFISVQTNVSPFWKRRYFVINTREFLLYKDEMSKNALSTVNYSNDAKRIAPADEDEDTFVPNSYMIYTKQGDSFQLLADDKKFGKQIYATLKQFV
ncbi:hypothetical protein HMPREF1544_04636 [Mucor circinelloides 1006PhL]|uniref:ADF-H domain-containing protein n=1 Tax=Mucor circinelloides f. circinelloides (strain 1006PhL) TaxID=1220926 RepID=S2K062_MUCC1|nr:hypothetical protein HMPREF1544_04636 [Mucor circinelloides 1006PhL]